MYTKRSFFKFIIPFFVAVLAFVYFAQPISAKADSATLTYQTTSMSLSDVKALFTAGAAATVTVALVILGFIALTYCSLRNVQVPLQFSSKQSFFDKCQQVGQYMVDNATDSIKDVLYSVYTYCQDNGITSPIGLSKFLMVNAIKFFGAISNWLASSFVSNVKPVAQGFLDSFTNYTFVDIPLSQYSYTNFNNYSTISSDFVFGFELNSWGYSNHALVPVSPLYHSTTGFYLVLFENGFGVYELLDQTTLSLSSEAFIQWGSVFNPSSPSTVTWTSSGVTTASGRSGNKITITPSSLFFGNPTYVFLSFPEFIYSLGFSNIVSYALSVTSSVPSSLSVSDVSIIQGAKTTSISDTIYNPTDDEIELDPDGVAEDLLGVSVGALTLDWLIKLLTQDRALTLTSALPDSNRVNGAGTYAFPDFTGIWKYPRYFFNTLGSWLLFVGGCLNAVTVGDGGLSWLFYGGFVFLICGGVIGKILLG